MNLDKWFRRRSPLNIFLICSSGSLLSNTSISIRAIMVVGIMRNFSIIWNSVSRKCRHFLSRALAAPLFNGAEPFVKFW